MYSMVRWWIPVICLAGMLSPCCSGVQVFVRDEKRYAVLFQSVVLPCHFNSVSTQVPVVQWVYKSYCRDRTRDAFSFSDSLSGSGGLGGGMVGGSGRVGGGYDTGTTANLHLDCSDSSRTVRTVASISGSSVTLSEYYKNRDISIINKADLRLGELQWGDSGIYICKVVISDDLEGENEASVELLVLGFSGVPQDLLPDIDLKIMPEWLFVTAVALGGVLFLLLVGVCWCQCCPHSCCCYVSCWCCPDTCCCPRHLYEAGKGIKTSTSTPQMAAYAPYFVSGVPTMVPIAPPTLVEKMSSISPSDSTLLAGVPVHGVAVPYRVPSSQDQHSLRVLQYVEKQLAHFNPAKSNSHQSCSVSELSSLHEGENGFQQSYRNVQKKALPAIPDLAPQPEPQRHREARSPDPQRQRDARSPDRQRQRDARSPDPQRHRDECSPEPQRCRDGPSSPRHYHDNGSAEPKHYNDDPLPPRRYSDDPPPTSQTNRSARNQHRPNNSQDDHQNRWNPRSEHLQRKEFRTAGRTGSLDELEEFAASYGQRGARGEKRGDDRGDYEMELQEFSIHPSHRDAPPQRYHNDDEYHRSDSDHDRDRDGHHRQNDDREEHHRRRKENGRHISPISSPKKRRGTWETEHPVPPPPRTSPPSSSSREKDYDSTFLNRLLERKSKLRGVGHGRSGSQGEDDSDTPSKSSSKKSSSESSRHCSRSPTNRRDLEFLPPYAESERGRADRPSPQLTYNRPSQMPGHVLPGHREEPKDTSKKVNTLLSRDSLIV